MQRLGATPSGEGQVEFRVWAPKAHTVSVLVEGGRHELIPGEEGVFAGMAPARPGDDYRFLLDQVTELADPCSRCQPQGLRGPSRVVETAGFEIAGFEGVPLEEV